MTTKRRISRLLAGANHRDFSLNNKGLSPANSINSMGIQEKKPSRAKERTDLLSKGFYAKKMQGENKCRSEQLQVDELLASH
jgi:hypothetical protein